MYIKLEPTPEGYYSFGRQFLSSILNDIKTPRREDASYVLRSLLEITGWLAKENPELFVKLLDELPKEK